MIKRFKALAAVIAIGLLLAGCQSDSGYSQQPAVSPLGQAGECAACGKPISRIEERHLHSFQGIQYVVCDAQCAEQLEDDVIHDRFASHAH